MFVQEDIEDEIEEGGITSNLEESMNCTQFSVPLPMNTTIIGEDNNKEILSEDEVKVMKKKRRRGDRQKKVVEEEPS